MLPFTYEDFSKWYDDYEARCLEPARNSVVRTLEELLDELAEPDRTRVEVRAGRIKKKVRVWRKLNEKYEDRVHSLDDIPKAVDDLVGLRIVCTNASDLAGIVDLLSGLPGLEDHRDPVLAVEDGSIRDYVNDPKPSGYRAYHVNLCTAVPVGTYRRRVTCELQVRTLLQDSWGELTHEDSYKPDTELPPLVDTLSRGMAALMATLDDLAQELREEIDRITSSHPDEAPAMPATVVSEETTEDLDTTPQPPAIEIDTEPVYRYLRERIASLERPIDLASLAWELQRDYGQSIVNDWLGHGTFKQLVTDVVPEVRLTPHPPTHVLPVGFSAESLAGNAVDTIDVPRAASLLHQADRSFPLVSSGHWCAIYDALSAATRDVLWFGPPDVRALNDLTRRARDTERARAHRVTRRHVQHVAAPMQQSGQLAPDMTAAEVSGLFIERTVERARDLGVADDEIEVLRAWLDGCSTSTRPTS